MSAEMLEWELRLRDGVTGPSKKMADGMRRWQREADKAQAASDRAADKAAKAAEKQAAKQEKLRRSMDFSQELERTEKQLRKLERDPAGYKKLIKAQRELREQREKLEKQVGGEGFLKSFKNAFSLDRFTKAAFYGELMAEGVMKAGEFLLESVKKAVEFFTDGLKGAAAYENLKLGYSLSLGEKGGAESRKDIERFAKMTGFDDDEIAKLILPMRRAGFDQKASRTAFAGAVDIAAGMGKGGDLGLIQGILDTFQHIKLKGGVSEKLLPSIGVDAPAFYKSLAKSQGVSTEAAKKMATEGKIDPQTLLNTIYDQIEKRQGGKQLGSGGVAYGNTVEAKYHKLQQLPEEYMKKIADSPAWTRLSERMGKVLEALDPDGPMGERVIGKLMSTFEKLEGWVERTFTPENIEAFADELAKVPDYLDKIISAGEIIAVIWGGSKIVGAFTSLAGLLPGIATAAGTVAGSLGTMAAPLGAVVAAMGAWAFAAERISKTVNELGGLDLVKRDIVDWFSGEQPAVSKGNPGYADYEAQRKANVANARARASVSVAPTIHVHVNGGDDAQRTGQVVGQEAGRHLVTHVERAAAEAGAGS